MQTLIVSRHDFRTPLKANIHFIGAELARRGQVGFYSIGHSAFSLLKEDQRNNLPRSDVTHPHEGVDCFLWSTSWHPIALKPWLVKLERHAVRQYLRKIPERFLSAIDGADVVILESGLPIILAEIIRERRPDVWLVYNASDDLKTIGAGRAVIEKLEQSIHLFDLIRLPSKLLVPLVPASDRIAIIPHGFDQNLLSMETRSPYGLGRHVVSLGSMLFDPSVFQIAADHFSDVTFHLIGVGSGAERLTQANVRVYPQMRHTDTIPFIRHADVGVACYRISERAAYLADTSMKLKQFAAFGLPSVCPRFACGDEPSRIAYQPSDPASIVDALTRALQLDRRPSISLSTWADVVDAMLPGAEPASMGRS